MSKILIIDDNKDNILSIKANIKIYRSQYHILTALSGKEGINIAKTEKPDTILLDIIMPEMDGYEVCKQLKQDVVTKYIPIIFLTAVKISTNDKIAGLKLGAEVYLTKPVEPGELIAQIDVMLRIKKAGDQLRSDKVNLNKLVEIKTKNLTEAYTKIQREINERKEMDDTLKNSEERLKIIFESAPDAIYLTDFKGTFLDGNKTAEDILGYQKEELIGKSFLTFKILPAKELLKASKLLLKNVQGKGTGPDEFHLIRKDGSQVPVEISTYPVKIKNKNVVLGIARDITERKQAEEKLKSRNKELETWAEVTTGRELFMLNLKKEINDLLEKYGEKPKYKIPS
jgi:PAS domain S-box-containing protein